MGEPVGMDNTPFESLLESRHCPVAERWYPTAVDTYRYAFKIDTRIENSGALRKNLAYSMQYLEFLEKEFYELNVSSVIYVMLVKTYVITGMSILEGLFSNIIKSNGWWKKTNLESLGTTQANETKFGEDKYVIKTELLRKVPDYEMRMDLDALITVLSRHHQALNIDHLVYPALMRLKRLRNRVHLQMLESNTDHDYNAFDYSVKKEMGAILHTILTSAMVTNNPAVFEFLIINVDEQATGTNPTDEDNGNTEE